MQPMFYGERGVRQALGVLSVGSLLFAGCSPANPDNLQKPGVEAPVKPRVISEAEKERRGRLLVGQDFSGLSKLKPLAGPTPMGRFFMRFEEGLEVRVDENRLNEILSFCGDNSAKPGFHVAFTEEELPYTVVPGSTYIIIFGSEGLDELAKTKLENYKVPPESKNTALRNLKIVTTNYALVYATCFGLISTGSIQGEYDYRKAVEEAEKKADRYVEMMLAGQIKPAISVNRAVKSNV